MAQLTLITNLATQWRYFHQLQTGPSGGDTCISIKLGHQPVHILHFSHICAFYTFYTFYTFYIFYKFYTFYIFPISLWRKRLPVIALALSARGLDNNNNNQALAEQLQVTPGQKLNGLIFEALANWTILKAKREPSSE